MKTGSRNLATLLDRLEATYGQLGRPTLKTALEWILWENVGYLIPDDRRQTAFLALRTQTGLSAGGILALSPDELQSLAKLGGMMPDKRVEKLLTIAQLVQDEFGGKLEAVLKLPLAKARRALKRFPGIADPGADKILLFTKAYPIPALDSNGLRCLIRLGLVEEAKNYSASYRNAIGLLAQETQTDFAWLTRAFTLLRKHGQVLCKNNDPKCDECLFQRECPSAD
ncbi:MAG: endonuclease III [Planctomycetota bacterium]|jgi:endonuclease III